MSDTSKLPDLRYIRELAKVFKQYELDELEIETGAHRMLLRRNDASRPAGVAVSYPEPTPVGAAAPPRSVRPLSDVDAPETEGDFITSPFVGTYYGSPRPDMPAFVEVGSKVAQDQTVCIVEAMKLFNEIVAEFPCVIEECLVDNGQPVEYGTKLFRVRKL